MEFRTETDIRNPFGHSIGMMDTLKMAGEINKKADAMNLELGTLEIKALDPDCEWTWCLIN